MSGNSLISPLAAIEIGVLSIRFATRSISLLFMPSVIGEEMVDIIIQIINEMKPRFLYAVILTNLCDEVFGAFTGTSGQHLSADILEHYGP